MTFRRSLRNQAVIKERDKLLFENKQFDAELAIINSVGEAMSKQLDVKTVTRIVGDRIRSIFDTEVTEILLLDTKTNMINVPYSYYRDYAEVEPFALGEGITSKVISSGKPLVFGTGKEQVKSGAIFDDAVGEADETESYMGVPIRFGKKVLGVVSVQSYKKNAYSEDNVRLLSTLSSNMGIALENARLFEETKILLAETQQRNAELGVINSVQEGLVAHMDIQEIYDLVGEKIREIFDAQVVSIGKYDHNKKMCEFKYDIEKGERFYDKPRNFNAIDKHIIKTKKRLVINEDLINKFIELGEGKPKPAEGTEAPKSAVWVPLIVGKKVTGYVSLQNVDRENAFGESAIQLLNTLSNSLSIALINAELFEETKQLLNQTEQRNAELGVINSVQEGLVEQMDIQAIYDLVGEKIQEIFDAQVVSIGTYDIENEMCHFKYDIEKGERFYDEPRKFNAIDKILIHSNQSIIINEDLINKAVELGEKKPVAAEGTEMPKSALWIPLSVGDTVKGYVSLQNVDRENAFSESDIRLITTLSNSMSVALENARLFDETNRLYEETKQQTIELQIINSVGEGLAHKLDYQSIIDLVGDKIREVFDAQIVSISTYNKEENQIHHRYAVELDERFYFDEPQDIDYDRKEILETKKPLIFGTSQEIIDHSGGGTVAGEMPQSFMGVPMILNQEATGVITVQDLDKQNLFEERDVRLLMTLASNMGVALENARLFEETTRLLNETQQRNTELSILNAIQEGLVMEMDFEAIINLVGDKLREAMGFLDLGIRLYDKENDILQFPYEYEHGERLYIEDMPPTVISRYVLETGKMLLIKDNSEEAIKKLGITGMTLIPGTDQSKSVVAVPIMLGNVAKGLILIENYEKQDAFSNSDIRLLTTLANSMSIALENARLFEQTKQLLHESRQRNAELSILNAIQEGLVMEMDLHGIINLVGDKLREALYFQDIGIRLYDKEKNLLHFHYEYERGQRLKINPMPPTMVSKYVLDNKEMLLVRHNDESTIKELGIEGVDLIPGTDRSKSFVALPIVTGNEAKGLIIIENYEKEDAYSDSDIRLLTTLANSMSVALENARLFDETLRLYKKSEERASELATVNRISQAIVGHLEINKLIDMIGDNTRELFNANIAYVALLDKETNMINFPYGFGEDFPPLKYGEGLTSKIIETRKPLLLNKEVDERTEELGVSRIGVRSASYLGVPIPIGNEITGVLSVQSTEEENKFTDDDMRMLNTIAAHVGIAINNANAYQELNTTLQNLKSTQDQLVAQEKLASLGQLTAGIAHEIKNPLNFVNNFSELSSSLVEELKENFDSQKENIKKDVLDEVYEILDTLKNNSNKIREHGKRADSIVYSMLQHSRGKTSEKQSTDINTMLDEDLNLVYHGLRAQDSTFNISIEKEYDEKLEKINVVPQDVSRVFLNILNNGCYEAHKKKVDSKSNEPAKISIKTRSLQKNVEIRIRDNGGGIPVKIQDELFKPFFTTKPAGKGTGLGLSISYDIVVHAHKGELLFETEPGEFTEFIIRLPKSN
jgi:GAF domain-containing protein